jgi:hypothetical protein
MLRAYFLYHRELLGELSRAAAQTVKELLPAAVRYMMRSPVSLTRLRFTPGAKEVVYARKGGHDASEPGEKESIDADEFVARVPVQIPGPRRHLVRYYGAYSN